MPSAEDLLPTDDDEGFYGKGYYESFQPERYGWPTLPERARLDLHERGLHWIRTLLRYKPPPARVLELGCAHGGFVALLRWVGYDAVGLEVSSSLVEFAQTTFEVPVLLGPVEQQNIEAGSLDAIVLMDVLEHLVNPVGTIRHCLGLLRPDGVLVIQTPQYREATTFDELRTVADPFLSMLIPEQHLYLFSRKSICLLMESLGVKYVAFEPAMFSAYDMFLVSSRSELSARNWPDVELELLGTPMGRLVTALLDQESDLKDTRARLAESEADRAERLEAIERLGRELTESEADRVARLETIERLGRLLAESESDRAVRLKIMEQQGRRLVELDTELARMHSHAESLRSQLTDEWAANAAKEESIRRQSERIEELQERLARANQTLATTNQTLATVSQANQRLEGRLADTEGILSRLERSVVYRLMRRAGLWGWLAHIVERKSSDRKDEASHSRSERTLRRIAVDLTPMLPGGDNGGAKVMTVELIRHLVHRAPTCEFVLLTSSASHDELAALDGMNVRRICVSGPHSESSTSARPQYIFSLAGRIATRLPEGIRGRLRRAYEAVLHHPRTSGLLRELNADLLFCPFTAPFHYDPRVPAVCVIYDLQHRYYPQYFTDDDRANREKHFQMACRAASSLVCISHFVRGTVLESANVEPDRVEVIHIRLQQRLPVPAADVGPRLLSRLNLVANEYLIYPANFWPHKNHELLLTAFGLYRSRHTASSLKLVCTGAPEGRMEQLQDAVKTMGLESFVSFPGFLADDEFAALARSAKGVIFPSLYEGFGMPILEAMAMSKPVLCSRVASLPEVAGDAALYFDPRKPLDIANAIALLETDAALVESLVSRGRARAAEFGDVAEMADEYWRVFEKVLLGRTRFTTGLYGVYPDGWAAERVTVSLAESDAARSLLIRLSVPDWFPTNSVKVRIQSESGRTNEVVTIARGGRGEIWSPISTIGECFELTSTPALRPKDCGIGEDTRRIGFRWESARVVSADGSSIELEPDGHVL